MWLTAMTRSFRSVLRCGGRTIGTIATLVALSGCRLLSGVDEHVEVHTTFVSAAVIPLGESSPGGIWLTVQYAVENRGTALVEVQSSRLEYEDAGTWRVAADYAIGAGTIGTRIPPGESRVLGDRFAWQLGVQPWPAALDGRYRIRTFAFDSKHRLISETMSVTAAFTVRFP